jgi:hypothetical protein
MSKPQRLDRQAFFNRAEAVFAGVPLDELTGADLTLALSVAQYATDMALVEAERRGLIDEVDGAPCIPFELPEGVEFTNGNAPGVGLRKR